MSFSDARGHVQGPITQHTGQGSSSGQRQGQMRDMPQMGNSHHHHHHHPGMLLGMMLQGAHFARPQSRGMSYDEMLRLDEQNVKIGVTPEQYRRNVKHRKAAPQDCSGADPISQEDFERGEMVAEIRKCKHIFKPAGLQQWFKKEHLCPVCRVDIR